MQEGPKTAGQVFVDIIELLRVNGTKLEDLDDGALRRFFNETVKNTTDITEKQESERIKQLNEEIKKQNEENRFKNAEIREKNKTLPVEQQVKEISLIPERPELKTKGRTLHDSMSTQMSEHEALLRNLVDKHVHPWNDQISDTLISDFEQLFDNFTNELKNSPEWKDYWEKLDPKPKNMEHVQERILMAYRFKMFQMITYEYKTAKKEKKDPETQQVIMKDGKPVMEPTYNIKQVASLDIVLQKLNGAYDRRKAENKTLREQFDEEYKNESGPSYVVDLNMMLAEAIKRRAEGQPKSKVDKYIAKQRIKIRDELVKKDKYGIHVSEEKAKTNFDHWFPSDKLVAKVDAYEKVCDELGFDVNAMVRIMTGVKETQKPDSPTKERVLEHKDLLVFDDYIKMLKAKVYLKDYENSKNEDIFVEFDEKKFLEVQENVKKIINENPALKSNMQALMRADLFKAARDGNYAKFYGLLQMGADLQATELDEKDSPKTAFEIILPKLTTKQLKSLLENKDENVKKEITQQYSVVKRNEDFIGQAFQAAQKGDIQGLKIYVRSGVNITRENKNGESILDILKAKYPEKKTEIDKLVEIAMEESKTLELDNPQQYAVLTAYAKNIHVMEYFEFRDALENAQKLTGPERVQAAKEVLENFIYSMNENIIALNLDGQGTPSRIIELRDELNKYKGKLDTLTAEDANKIIELCQQVNVAYNQYLLQKGGQLPNENSRQIVSSKYPVHKFLEMYDKYKEGTQSDRNHVWNAIKKHGDFNSKNLDGVTPLQMATDIALKTGKRDLMLKVLDGGAKTTEYKRGFWRKLQDAFKGFPKNQLKYFNEAPPRTIAEIQQISGKDFDVDKITDRIVEKSKSTSTRPMEETPQTKKVRFAEEPEIVQPSVTPTVTTTVDAPSSPMLSSLQLVLSEPPKTDVREQVLTPKGPPPYSPQVDSLQSKPKSDGLIVEQWLEFIKDYKNVNVQESRGKNLIKEVLEKYQGQDITNDEVKKELAKAIDSKLPPFISGGFSETFKRYIEGIKDGKSPQEVTEKQKLGMKSL